MTRIEWNQVANLREQILFVCVLLVLVVLFLRMVYLPRSERREILRAKVQGLSMEQEALARFSSSTPVVPRLGLSEGRGVKMRVLSGEVRPAFREVPELLAELTHPRFLGGVEVKNLSYLPPVKVEGYEKVDFTLQVVGGFSQVTRYLARLEEFPALFQVINLSVNVGDGSKLRAEINGRFYRMGSTPLSEVVLQGEVR